MPRLVCSSLLLLSPCLTLTAQDQSDNWPLTLQIESSSLTDMSGGNAAAARQAEEMGAASPIVILFRGTLNGESHWNFECEGENVHTETHLCTELSPGRYRARWMHNRQMIVLILDVPNGPSPRFLNVTVKTNNPPPTGDAVSASQSYDLPLTKPDNQQSADYPLLVHVYGIEPHAIQQRVCPSRCKDQRRVPWYGFLRC